MLNLKLKPKTENMLKIILSQYENQETFAHSIIDYEIAELKKGIINIKIDLKKFEQKYNISSQIFYEKFTKGEFGDDEDFIIWSGIYEMMLRNETKLKAFE
jgi:hypothetical protein